MEEQTRDGGSGDGRIAGVNANDPALVPAQRHDMACNNTLLGQPTIEIVVNSTALASV
jgi:hypothetical protein